MPSQFPCAEFLTDCECENFPVRNFSQETPDVPVFLGNYNQPPTTGTWFAPACLGFCESEVSQEDADACAAAVAVECSFDGAPDDHNPLPHGIHPAQRFRNTLQECDSECPDGNVTTVLVPAGTVVSSTQADADARAHGLACKRAKELKVCFVTESPLPEAPADVFISVPIIAVGGNGDYLFTIESGALPPGITFDEVGLLSGTPTTADTYNFSLRVDDTGGATAVKAFTWVITTACNDTVDWYATPGDCRLQVKDFNVADWMAGTFPPPNESDPCVVSYLTIWDGKLPTLIPSPGVGVSVLYQRTFLNMAMFPIAHMAIVGTFDGFNYSWFMSLISDLTTDVYFHAIGPVGPTPNALGTYVRDDAQSCTGPVSLEIEGYTP